MGANQFYIDINQVGANANYNGSYDATNYERARMYWNSNVFTIATESGGTGTLRNIALMGGKVGIGYTTPNGDLHLQKNVAGDVLFLQYNTNNAGRVVAQLNAGSANQITGGSFDFRAYGAGYTETLFGQQMAGGGALIGNANNYTGPLIIGNYSNGSLIFGTKNLERARIDNNGLFGIGTTSINAKLHILSTTEQLRAAYDTSNYLSVTVGSDGRINLTGNTNNTTSNGFLLQNIGTNNAGVIINRQSISQQAFIGLQTGLTQSASSPFWTFGVQINSNIFNIQSYDGTTLSGRLSIDTSGNIIYPNSAASRYHYATTDQTTNYSRARHYWNGSTYTIGTEFGGTATLGSIALAIGGTNVALFNASTATFTKNVRILTGATLFIASSSLTATPTAGTIENNGTNPYYTNDAGVRSAIVLSTDTGTGVINANANQSILSTSFINGLLTIYANASGGAFTITLLNAATLGAKKVIIIKVDSSANNVTVSPAASSGELINGQASYVLTTQFQMRTFTGNTYTPSGSSTAINQIIAY